MIQKYLDEQGTQYLINKILTLLGQKVNIESGKGLSEEDFTTVLKRKLENLDLNISIQDDILIIEKGE